MAPPRVQKKSRKNAVHQTKKNTTNRPKHLWKWTDEQMKRAMEAVMSGELGVNLSALEHGVPKTTLKDRIDGHVKHRSNPGPVAYLDPKEEEELVEFLLECSRIGYGKTKHEVLQIVETAAKKKGIVLKNHISDGWWYRFCHRWPNLSLRKGDPFSQARAEMTTKEVFTSYFNLLKETLIKHELIDKPAQIYNCDESGMPLQHKMPKTVAQRGTKKVRQRSSGNKAHISILACGNAVGQAIPPMVIFAGEKFNYELSNGEVPGTFYGMADSGWMDQELFSKWFSSHFLKYAVPGRPLLLLLDGHSSHFTLELVQTAAEEDVIIFCLPPHTTADSQPLDTSVFSPLKSYWSQACRDYMFANPGRVVTKFQFSSLFRQAWSKGMSVDNICAGFRKTGVFPFNPEAILKEYVENNPSADESEIEPVNRSSSSTQMCFTHEQISRFEERYENNYDIYTDHDYVAWLEMFHPESIPSVEMMLGVQNDGEFDNMISAGSPNSDPTPSASSHSDCSLSAGSPHSDCSPSAGSPHSDPTLLAGSPHSDPTPSVRSPNSDPTPSAGSPNSDPTPSAGSPHSDCSPSAGSPHSDPTLLAGSPHSDPTQSVRSPNSDPTPSADSPNSDPTPSAGSPHSDCSPLAGSPHSDPTPLAGSPHSDPTPSARSPNSDPTPSAGSPHSDPTPSAVFPHSNCSPSAGSPHNDPTPSAGSSHSELTPTTPCSSNSSFLIDCRRVIPYQTNTQK